MKNKTRTFAKEIKENKNKKLLHVTGRHSIKKLVLEAVPLCGFYPVETINIKVPNGV